MHHMLVKEFHCHPEEHVYRLTIVRSLVDLEIEEFVSQ
jgi:hypothetical protein